MELSRIDAAEPILKELSQGDGSLRWNAFVRLGRLYEETGRYPLAEEHFRTACGLQPNRTASWVFLGCLLNLQGRHAEAYEAIKQGLGGEGPVDEAQLNLGNILRAMEDYSGAILRYQAALQLTPDYAEARADLQELETALTIRKELDDYLRGCPEPGQASLQLHDKMEYYLEKDMPAVVLEVCIKWLLLDPDSTRARYQLADAMRMHGRAKEAEPILLSLVDCDSNMKREWTVALCLGRLYKATGRHPEAERQFRRACRLHHEAPESWEFLGGLLLSQGKIDEAIEVFNRGLTAQGDLTQIHVKLGFCLRARERYEDALQHFKTAQTLYPDCAEAIHAIEDLLAALKIRQEVTSICSPMPSVSDQHSAPNGNS
jgi:tetratricopeptide (TPR) repeat protein